MTDLSDFSLHNSQSSTRRRPRRAVTKCPTPCVGDRGREVNRERNAQQNVSSSRTKTRRCAAATRQSDVQESFLKEFNTQRHCRHFGGGRTPPLSLRTVVFHRFSNEGHGSASRGGQGHLPGSFCAKKRGALYVHEEGDKATIYKRLPPAPYHQSAVGGAAAAGDASARMPAPSGVLPVRCCCCFFTS